MPRWTDSRALSRPAVRIFANALLSVKLDDCPSLSQYGQKGGIAQVEDAHVSIARYLRERRESSGLTRAALSQAAGISPALIQKIEQGTRTPTLEALAALFDALDVPELFRSHIIMMSLSHRFDSPLPATAPAVPAADRLLIDSLPYPASLQEYPAFDVLAVNEAWRKQFPGLLPGITVLEWMLLHPTSRAVIHDWERHIHLSVYAFRLMGPSSMPQARIDELIAILSAAPEWEYFWTTEPPGPHALDDPEVTVVHAETGEPTTLAMHNLDFALPRRNWSMITFTPKATD